MNSKCVSGYEGFLELSQKLSDSFPNQRFGPWGMFFSQSFERLLFSMFPKGWSLIDSFLPSFESWEGTW